MSSNKSVRRPPGAVATAMVTGVGTSPLSIPKEAEKHQQQAENNDALHARDPYELTASEGSSVIASYPFHGDSSLQQLSFTVGDSIRVLRKEKMWSWGELLPGREEGWFPHNYVGTTFKPLPGIHEMAAKMRKRREKMGAAEHGSGATESGAEGVALKDNTKSPATKNNRKLFPRNDGGSTKSDVASGTAGSEQVKAVPSVPVSEAAAGDAPGSDSHNPTSGEEGGALGAFNVVSEALPSLPPFFKDESIGTGGVSSGVPEHTTRNGLQVPCMDESAQIDGMGNSLENPLQTTGCKCVVM